MATAKVRREIELSDEPYRDLARRHGVSEATVGRYKHAYRKRLGILAEPKGHLSIAKIKRIFSAKGTNLQIALREDVAPATVSDIKRGRYHRDITGARPVPQRKAVAEGMREEIGRSTEPQKIIAARFGVCVATVKKYQAEYRAKHGIAVNPGINRHVFPGKRSA